MTIAPRQLGKVASGLYAALTDHAPNGPLKPLAGPAAGRQPRGLSDKQRATLLGTAAARIAEEARHRGRRWLRRFDTIHASGCRTKRQRWEALATLAEPLLARVDLATLALGWLDDRGVFRLNRQRRLAEDGALTECRVSRTLGALEAAGYVRRKLRRIYKHGRHWITRVTIHLRPRLFIDLGLGHQLAEARTRAKARRESLLRAAGARAQQTVIQELADAQQRRESHKRAQGARRAREDEQANVASFQQARERTMRLGELASQHPGLSRAELIALLDRLYPPT